LVGIRRFYGAVLQGSVSADEREQLLPREILGAGRRNRSYSIFKASEQNCCFGLEKFGAGPAYCSTQRAPRPAAPAGAE